MMQLEQRLQLLIGQQAFMIADLSVQLEKAQERIKELEKQIDAANPPS